MIKLALFGEPGSGKTTGGQVLERLCAERALRFHRLRLAEPLYACQQEIYRIAGRPLADRSVQDGVLLNFLGAHLRRINPTVLTDDFRRRLEALPDDGLVLCDDMRAVDAPSLRTLGFVFARIRAPSSLCLTRRAARGDLTVGAASHATEGGLETLDSDYVVDNDAAMSALRERLAELLERVCP